MYLSPVEVDPKEVDFDASRTKFGYTNPGRQKNPTHPLDDSISQTQIG